MKVLVFKTTVEDRESIQRIGPGLDSLVGQGHWNFALDDCDKILRIKSAAILPEMAIKVLADCGFECRELQD
ncbi:MAG TPA: hypothetical protein VK589_05370 [Chryseolinea sp.]|nr:hypothetical protein [Chryseolinea sp.]